MFLIARGVPLVLGLLLQAAPLPPSGKSEKAPLSWASVAIHTSDPDGRGGGYNHDEPNGITDRDESLREIISEGYNFNVVPFREDEIVGLPKWAQDARYDILARVDPEDAAAFQKLTKLSTQEIIAAFSARRPTGEMLMMQSLLRDRFHLRVHWETRDRAVYALVIAKGGLRLKPAVDPKHGEMSADPGHLAGKGVPLSFLASLLAVPMERTIVDQSGVPGAYDFDLRFEPRDDHGGKPGDEPDLLTALQEQLGLSLRSTHASVPVLVVDQVEPPTPN